MRRNSATFIFPFSRTYRSRKDSAPNSASSFSICSTASTWRRPAVPSAAGSDRAATRQETFTARRHRSWRTLQHATRVEDPVLMGSLFPRKPSGPARRGVEMRCLVPLHLLAAIAIPRCAQRARRPKTGRASLFRGYSNSFKVRAMAWRRSSISARTVPGSNFPSPFFFPAAIPVRSSMPCSTLPTGQT